MTINDLGINPNKEWCIGNCIIQNDASKLWNYWIGTNERGGEQSHVEGSSPDGNVIILKASLLLSFLFLINLRFIIERSQSIMILAL